MQQTSAAKAQLSEQKQTVSSANELTVCRRHMKVKITTI